MPSQINYLDTRKSSNGSIYFELKNLTYFCGQSITGNIIIDLKEQYEGNLVVLCLEGIEELSHPSSKNQSGSVNRIVKTTKLIYDFSQCQPHNVIEPDTMKVSFEMEIPNDLSSQVNIFYDYENCFRINYYLCAYIIPRNPNQKPLQGIQRILIFQEKSIADAPIYKNLKYSPRYMLFLGLGSYSLKLYLKKSNFYPGENTMITIDYDFSQLEKEVNQIKIDMIGVISNNSNQQHTELNILSTECEISQIKGIEKKQIFIPVTCPLSTQGQFAKLQFFFQLTPILKNKTSYKLKSLNQDINIYPNQNYYQNIHMPQIKHPKPQSHKQITELTSSSSLLIDQKNNKDFQKFSDLQQEYLNYYEIEKNFST
ncbi:arrestin (macronuclear) [Tetrahymena thermophila SB210]|uniref:Arrestin n=1 Tax=Tetrahymena thermophila (strain SB210) TaxID=312017 RepID=Q24DJ8_TETTS|nr:arrestin [Tetrahymena thermophila SB210]EAS05850.1 arrestin [Tetrahymena thermophila SB210]|eukprot:XP_001026095.1 arrestin [Tetrahymena thermophila SB210]